MKKVTVLKNGPYSVSGKVNVQKITIEQDAEGNSTVWKNGDIEEVENPNFCRCGASKNAPFCDGSHIKENFDGSETASTDSYITEAKVIEGPLITLTDNQKLCAYARFCDTFGGIWQLASSATTDEEVATAKKQSENCPSGRLIVWDNESKKPLDIPTDFAVSYIEDLWAKCSGPLRITGSVEVISQERETSYSVRDKITLCRCGQSSNKPFCDGTHASSKYQAKYPLK